MWILNSKLVTLGSIAIGSACACSVHQSEGGGVCPRMHTETKALGEATQFEETGAELLDSVSGSHVIAAPSDSDPDRKLTITVTPITGAEVTEQVASTSICQRVSVPVNLTLQLDDDSIVGELRGEARLQSRVPEEGATKSATKSVGAEAPLSAFSRFPPGEFPERVVTYLAFAADGNPGTGSVITEEVRPDPSGATLRGRRVLTW